MSIKLSDQVSVIKQINGSEISTVEYGLSAFNEMFEITGSDGQVQKKPMGETDKTEIDWSTDWPETTTDCPFVWTRVTYTTDSGDEYSYTCSGKKGSDGASGRGISQIDSYYVANSEKPEISKEFDFSGWKTDANEVELTSTNTKLWRCQVVTYTDTTKQTIGPTAIAVYVKDGEPAQCLYLTATDSCFKQIEIKDNDTISQKITPDKITITANVTNYTGSNVIYSWKKYIENESTSENLNTTTDHSSSITISKDDAVSATYECTAKIGDVTIGTDRIYIPVVGESEIYWLLDNTFNVAADAEGKILEETKVVLQPVCYKNGIQQELSFYDSNIKDSSYYYWPQNDNITFSGISSGKEPKIIITIPKGQMLKDLNGSYWFKAKCAGSGVWHTYRYTVTILKQSKGIKSVEYQYYATVAGTSELEDKDQSGAASEISGLTNSYGPNYPKLWQRYKTNYDDGTSSAWSKWNVIAYYGSDGANATLRRILLTSDIHRGIWQTENITFYFQKTSGETLDNTWINDTSTSYYTFWFGDSSTAKKTESSASSGLEITADVFKSNSGKDFTIEWYSDSTRKTLYDVETIEFIGTDIDISLSNDNIVIPADAEGNISTGYSWSNTTMTAQAYKDGVAVTPTNYTWTWNGCTVKMGSNTTVQSDSTYTGTVNSLVLASMTADSAKITCQATIEGQKTEIVTGYVVKQKQGIQGEPGKDGEAGSDGAPGKDGTSAPNIIATPDHFWAGNTITLSVAYGDQVYETAKSANLSEKTEIAIDELTYNGKQCYFKINNTDNTTKYFLNSTENKKINLKLGKDVLGVNNIVVELVYKESEGNYTQIDTKTLYPYTSDLHIDLSDDNVVVLEGVTTASVMAVLKCQGQAVMPDGYETKDGVVTATGWTCEGATGITPIGDSADGVKITGEVNKTYTVSATYNEETVSAQFKIVTIQEGKNAKYVVLSLDGTSPTHFTKETVTTNGEQVTKISPESVTITATLVNGAAGDKPSFQWQKKSTSNDGWENVEKLKTPMTPESSELISKLKVLNTQDGMYRCQATIDGATTEDAIYLPIIGQGEVYWLLDSAKTIAVDTNNEVTNNVTFDLYPVCYKEGVKQDLNLSDGFSCNLVLGSSSLTEGTDYTLNKTDTTTTDKISLTIKKGFVFTNGQTVNGTLTATCGTNPHTYSFTITPVKQGEKGKDGSDGANAKSYQIKTNQTYHSSSWQTADLVVDFQETNGSADWTNVVNGNSTGYVLAYFGAAGSYPTEAGKALLADTVANATSSTSETTVKTLTIAASKFQNNSMPLQIYWFSGGCSWVDNKFTPAAGSVLRDWETIEYVGMNPTLVVNQNCIIFQADSTGKTTIDSSNLPTITATAKKYNGTTNSTDDLYATYTWSWKGTSATSPISGIKINGVAATPKFDGNSKTCSITTTSPNISCVFSFSELDNSVDSFNITCTGKYYKNETSTDALGDFPVPSQINIVKQRSGIDGSPGKGISSIISYYASATEMPTFESPNINTGIWKSSQSDIDNLILSQGALHLWQCQVITYTTKDVVVNGPIIVASYLPPAKSYRLIANLTTHKGKAQATAITYKFQESSSLSSDGTILNWAESKTGSYAYYFGDAADRPSSLKSGQVTSGTLEIPLNDIQAQNEDLHVIWCSGDTSPSWKEGYGVVPPDGAVLYDWDELEYIGDNFELSLDNNAIILAANSNGDISLTTEKINELTKITATAYLNGAAVSDSNTEYEWTWETDAISTVKVDGSSYTSGTKLAGKNSTEFMVQALKNSDWASAWISCWARRYVGTTCVLAATRTAYLIKQKDGQDGAAGAPGRGIKSITTYYYATSTDTTPTTATGNSSVKDTGYGSNGKNYLWQKTVTKYDDNTSVDTGWILLSHWGEDGAKGEKGDTGATGANAVQYEIETNFTEMYVTLFQDTKNNVTTKTFQYTTNGDTESQTVTTKDFDVMSYLGVDIYKIVGSTRTKESESSSFGGIVRWTTYYGTNLIASEEVGFSNYDYGYSALGQAPGKQLTMGSAGNFTEATNVICFPWYDTSVEAVLTDYNNYHDSDFYILVEYLDSNGTASLAVPVKIPLKRALSNVLAKFETTAYGFNDLTEDGTKGIKFEAAKGMTFYAGDAAEGKNIIAIYKAKATDADPGEPVFSVNNAGDLKIQGLFRTSKSDEDFHYYPVFLSNLTNSSDYQMLWKQEYEKIDKRLKPYYAIESTVKINTESNTDWKLVNGTSSPYVYYYNVDNPTEAPTTPTVDSLSLLKAFLTMMVMSGYSLSQLTKGEINELPPLAVYRVKTLGIYCLPGTVNNTQAISTILTEELSSRKVVASEIRPATGGLAFSLGDATTVMEVESWAVFNKSPSIFPYEDLDEKNFSYPLLVNGDSCTSYTTTTDSSGTTKTNSIRPTHCPASLSFNPSTKTLSTENVSLSSGGKITVANPGGAWANITSTGSLQTICNYGNGDGAKSNTYTPVFSLKHSTSGDTWVAGALLHSGASGYPITNNYFSFEYVDSSNTRTTMMKLTRGASVEIQVPLNVSKALTASGGLSATTGTFSSTLTASGGLSATTGTFSNTLTANGGKLNVTVDSPKTSVRLNARSNAGIGWSNDEYPLTYLESNDWAVYGKGSPIVVTVGHDDDNATSKGVYPILTWNEGYANEYYSFVMYNGKLYLIRRYYSTSDKKWTTKHQLMETNWSDNW